MLTGFAAVLWYMARRVMAKQDEIAQAHAEAQEKTNAKLESILQYLQNELRSFDVRLSVVETLVLPKR